MRPVIKKKRIDPRYFLNETVNRDELDEKKADRDYDGDGEVESPEEEWRGSRSKAIRKALGKEEHERVGDKDGDGIPDEKDSPGKRLLKGERSLYEKIRAVIEEMFGEISEEVDISSIALRKKKGGYTKMTKKEVAAEKARAKKRGMSKRVKPGWPWNKEEKL